MKLDAKIAELILRAQNASDGGKSKSYINNSRKSTRDNRAGYAHKDPAIITAINLINSGKSNWKYAIIKCEDFSNPCWIVYFQTSIEGEKIQISFHTFNPYFNRFTGSSYRIKWDKKSSRDSAIKAYKHYIPNGIYA